LNIAFITLYLSIHMQNIRGYLSLRGLSVECLQLEKVLGAVKYKRLLTSLTLKYKPKIGPIKIAQLYSYITVVGAKYIVLPRTLVAPGALGIQLTLSNIIPSIRTINAELIVELYDNQILLINHLLGIFTPARVTIGTACAVLNLRAGMGKTFVAAGLIASLKVGVDQKPPRTLYIVPKVPLAVQAVKDLSGCLSCIVKQYVSRAPRKNKYVDPSTHDVTVIVIDSALLQDKTFFSQYSLVIYDEVHSYCSERRREIFRKCSTHICLGMSATTADRQDGFDPIAIRELAFDGIIHAETVPGFTYEDIQFTTCVNLINYYGPSEYTMSLTHPSTGKLFTPYMNKQFVEDPYRTALAIRELRRLYNWTGSTLPDGSIQRHCIYVFCEERNPLKTIYNALCTTFGGDVSAPELGEFVGGISHTDISYMKENARILLTTYGYSGTGISIDKMTAILFLTPRRANMKQILARILRRGSDTSITREVVDIRDCCTPIKCQYTSRALAYDFYSMDIVRTRVDYTDINLTE
jgi:hypothetical protein